MPTHVCTHTHLHLPLSCPFALSSFASLCVTHLEPGLLGTVAQSSKYAQEDILYIYTYTYTYKYKHKHTHVTINNGLAPKNPGCNTFFHLQNGTLPSVPFCYSSPLHCLKSFFWGLGPLQRSVWCRSRLQFWRDNCRKSERALHEPKCLSFAQLTFESHPICTYWMSIMNVCS